MQLISAIEVFNNKTDYYIIDIREKYEYDFANVGSKHIPMDEVCSRLDEFPKDKIIILMCKSGKRASALCNLLYIDFELVNVKVLDGGIEAYKEIVAPHLMLE